MASCSLHAQQPVADLLDSLDDERTGARIIYRALEELSDRLPRRWGRRLPRGGWVRTEGGNVGFNALSGEYEDLVSAGVTDPAVGSRSALQNAASIGSLIVTTDVPWPSPRRRRPPCQQAEWVE